MILLIRDGEDQSNIGEDHVIVKQTISIAYVARRRGVRLVRNKFVNKTVFQNGICQIDYLEVQKIVTLSISTCGAVKREA